MTETRPLADRVRDAVQSAVRALELLPDPEDGAPSTWCRFAQSVVGEPAVVENELRQIAFPSGITLYQAKGLRGSVHSAFRVEGTDAAIFYLCKLTRPDSRELRLLQYEDFKKKTVQANAAAEREPDEFLMDDLDEPIEDYGLKGKIGGGQTT